MRTVILVVLAVFLYGFLVLPSVAETQATPLGTDCLDKLNAAVVSDTIPGVMTAGSSYPVNITLRNTGEINWTGKVTGIVLGGRANAALFGPNRVAFAKGTNTNPGKRVTFNLTLTAPATPGTYTLRYRMMKDRAPGLPYWFGQPLIHRVRVFV